MKATASVNEVREYKLADFRGTNAELRETDDYFITNKGQLNLFVSEDLSCFYTQKEKFSGTRHGRKSLSREEAIEFIKDNEIPSDAKAKIKLFRLE